MMNVNKYIFSLGLLIVLSFMPSGKSNAFYETTYECLHNGVKYGYVVFGSCTTGPVMKQLIETHHETGIDQGVFYSQLIINTVTEKHGDEDNPEDCIIEKRPATF